MSEEKVTESLKDYVKINLSDCIEFYKEHRYFELNSRINEISKEEFEKIFTKFESEIFNVSARFRRDCNIESMRNLITFKRWIFNNAIMTLIFEIYQDLIY